MVVWEAMVVDTVVWEVMVVQWAATVEWEATVVVEAINKLCVDVANVNRRIVLGQHNTTIANHRLYLSRLVA
jgi:hypothetical protein